jgi:hypothetical protein
MAEAASVSQIARSRERLRALTNGAAATRAVPRIPPSAAAQASEGWSELPPRTGTIAKATSESDPTRKPAARSRSVRSPSTANRLAARIATRSPANAIAVSNTSRSAGALYCVRKTGCETKSARLAPSRPVRRISPHSHA